MRVSNWASEFVTENKGAEERREVEEGLKSISLYSVRMRENTDQNNSEYGHSLRSG